MEEVLALKLDADWVVLSARNTASGVDRAVETTSARLLTTELFRLQAENPKLTRTEALRQSMLDLMGKKAAGGFSYAHPAFWAPFSLGYVSWRRS